MLVRWFKKSAPLQDPLADSGEGVSPDEVYCTPSKHGFYRHVEELGGASIFVWRLTRLVACAGLLAMTVCTAVQARRQRDKDPTGYTLQVVVACVYVCTFILAIISVISNAMRSKLAGRYLALVLAFIWAIYCYRDIWPLATYTLVPLDTAEGWLMWIKIGVLTFAGVLVPLLIPRQYIPVDPSEPMPEPNPEQTACILSMALYSFLDPVVFLGHKIPHLDWEKLPPLADYDYAQNLMKRAFPYPDPLAKRSRRYIFFRLMKTFYPEYTIMASMLILRVICTFAIPIGMYHLLRHLSGDGDPGIVRPWIWIIWLLFGPIVGATAMQRYIFVCSRMLVQLQALLTQLVFNHALRVRIKAEVMTHSCSSAAQSEITPDRGSVADDSDIPVPSDDDEEEFNVASSVSDTTKGAGSAGFPEARNFVGKLNNLITADVNTMLFGLDFLLVVLYIPLQIGLCMWFLHSILGWSALVGLFVVIMMIPIPGYIGRVIRNVAIERARRSDARVQSVTEIMNVIRMIKLFGWETKTLEEIAEKRGRELEYLKQFKLLEMVNSLINFSIPILTMIFTFMTYTLIMRQELTAARAFSSISVFQMLQDNLYKVFSMVPTMIKAKVSMDRVNDFLLNTELVGMNETEACQATPLSCEADAIPDTNSNTIGICEAAFTWSSEVAQGSPLSVFTLHVDDELTFKTGAINLITGSTGSGKTSLLMALLGEMNYIPLGPKSYVQLPRGDGIAYAAQESWIQNETIRTNILFGAPYDKERYDKVIDQCCLKPDLELFEAGDNTEVGEKGLTLSGGQKARISLARAVYSSAKILLLDDVLAALDVHTAKWIVNRCFRGDLISGRTVLLATHSVSLAKPIAHFVVSLGRDGRIKSHTSSSNISSNKEELYRELGQVETMAELPHVADQVEQNAQQSDGKLVVAEEIPRGHVNWPALKLYFAALGGNVPTAFWTGFLGCMLLTSFTETLQAWYLGYWTRQYETSDSSEINVLSYINGYTFLLLFLVFSYLISCLVFLHGCLRASVTIHEYLVSSVLGTTFRWLDRTPTSRVITRCTQDIQAVDGPVAAALGSLVQMTSSMLFKFIGVIVFSPQFAVPGIAISVLGGWCGRIYMKSQLSVKREMSNYKAPVLGHVGAAISGLVSIRAYGAQEVFKLESMRRIDAYSRAARAYYCLNRWVSIRLEVVGALFAASLAAYLVYGGNINASDTGFSLTMAVGFSGMILWWIRGLNDFEVSGNSLERIQQYLLIEQEPKSTQDGAPPAYWPTSGDLVVHDLSARYSPHGPRVLHGISFHARAGEHIGIVGRTGSGKTSLSMALLRCIPVEGTILYDGVHIDALNLEALRSNITIIPQVPDLLSGTLRRNLDPFSQFDDASLNDALRAAGLFSLQTGVTEARLTLDSPVASGGFNLSVGQRQIIALARAILRQSKLLILDEATSAIDHETDSIIQKSLRQQLGKDVTVLIIAHRLQTVMDGDKIMVLDAGQLVEFDKPSELLKKRDGILRALVDESEDKDILLAMAYGTASK